MMMIDDDRRMEQHRLVALATSDGDLLIYLIKCSSINITDLTLSFIMMLYFYHSRACYFTCPFARLLAVL